MKNIAYWILGDSPENLKNHTPQSRKKIQALAMAIIIPTIMWFITGYLAATTMLKLSHNMGLLVGFVCALIIFLIDRMIAISSGGWKIFVMRILLGSAIAFIGSIMIDSAFLSEDIDYYMNQKLGQKSAEVLKDIELNSVCNMNEQKNVVQQRYADLQLASVNYESELDGTGGTKKYGKGEVAEAKSKILADARTEYLAQLMALKKMETEKTNEQKVAHDEVLRNHGRNSIITRINAMHEYIFSNPIATRFYYVLTALCFLLEMSVVIIKLFSKKSSYELEQERIEEIRNIKSEQILRSVAERSAIDKRLGHYGRAAMRAVK